MAGSSSVLHGGVRRVASRRHVFTKEECQRGYRAALEKCSEDWDLAAWFYYRIRGYYRKRKAVPNGTGEEGCSNPGEAKRQQQ